MSGCKMLNEFIWPADSHDDKRLKEERKFGSINYLQFLLGWPSRSPCKKCDKQLTHIVRVMQSCFVYYNLGSFGNESVRPVCSFIVFARHANNHILIRSLLL